MIALRYLVIFMGHPQVLADQLTIYQPREADYAQYITTGTPEFSVLPTALFMPGILSSWAPRISFLVFLIDMKYDFALVARQSFLQFADSLRSKDLLILLPIKVATVTNISKKICSSAKFYFFKRILFTPQNKLTLGPGTLSNKLEAFLVPLYYPFLPIKYVGCNAQRLSALHCRKASVAADLSLLQTPTSARGHSKTT